MSIFYNNYQKLVSDNDKELVKLPESDWEVLGRMMTYMETFHLSLFELEVIKKDLIGMAGEALLEGIDFLERLGMPEKEFCDRTAENAAKRSLIEWLIPTVKNIVLVIFGFDKLIWLMEGIPAYFGITIWTVFVACITGGVSLIDGRLRGKSVYMNRRRRNLIWVFEIILLVVLNFVFNTYIFSSPNSYFTGIVSEEFLITGGGTFIFYVLFALVLAVFLWNNSYWDRCSKKYQWQ